MHNCKKARRNLLDLAMAQPDKGKLPAELENCAACGEEYVSIRNALRSTRVTMTLAEPAEHFWTGYNERLRTRLDTVSQPSNHSVSADESGLVRSLRRLLTTSIRVPVPVACAMFAFVIFSFFLMAYGRQSSPQTPELTPAPVITKTVEVPVVREKLVTRVVYRNVHPRPGPAAPDRIPQSVDTQRFEPALTVKSLEGFKPANEARLTIIKESYQDEK